MKCDKKNPENMNTLADAVPFSANDDWLSDEIIIKKTTTLKWFEKKR